MNLTHYKLYDFLNKLDYIIQPQVEEAILKLCALTKCRADPDVKIGYESCFLFMALEEKFGFKRFLEFGTGRGTTSFLLACAAKMEQVTTIDIVHHDMVQNTWCDYKACSVSNAQIHAKCVEALGEPNTPITRIHSDSIHLTPNRIPGGPFDLIYVDGSHDYGPVKYDIHLTKALAADDAIIVFDDYDIRYGVYHALNEVLSDEDCCLVSLNGHRYGPEKEPDTSGHIIWAKGKYKELLNA